MKSSITYQKLREIYGFLPKKQKPIANFIIDNFKEASSMSIEELAKASGVNTSVVQDFAKSLEFSNYDELKNSLFESIEEEVLPDATLTIDEESSKASESRIKTIALKEIEALNQAVKTIDEDILNKSVERMIRAKRIFLFGGMSSRYILSYMNLIFTKCGVTCIPMSESGRYLFYRLTQLNPDDFIIIFKFHRPSKDFITLMKFLKERGVPNLLVTDCRVKAMIENADSYLYIERPNLGFVNSMLVPCYIANLILISYIEEEGSKAVDKLIEYKKIREIYS